jgi:hypothetical protein
LKDEALPRARDEKIGTIDIIRVSLQTAVRFVANLQLREEAAFPLSAPTGHHQNLESDHLFMKWEKQARDYGEERVAWAQARGRIEPFATLTAVKKGCTDQQR